MKKVKRKKYFLPLPIISKASKFGISLEKLREMVVLSARVTHPAGNRRYHDFIFQVEGEEILDIIKVEGGEGEEEPFYKCEACQDTKKIAVFDECPLCEGRGCRRCDGGLIRNFILCPTCKKV